jgi:hypothetical protein
LVEGVMDGDPVSLIVVAVVVVGLLAWGMQVSRRRRREKAERDRLSNH